MGASHSGEFSTANLKEFSKQYNFLKEQNDPRFGLIKVYKNKSSEEEVMVVTRLYPSEEEYAYFQKELDVRATFQHNNLLKIIGYQRESNSNICGNSRVFDIFSEYHSHNLKKEIQKRAITSDHFTESELWYLAESCLSLGKFLQQKGIYHGDLRPINIMLTDDGYLKIPDNGVLTPIKNNYFKALAGECRSYLSPELMRAYSRKDASPKYNVYKSDVFSLGMTLLYASNFVRPNTTCYEWSTNQINTRNLQDYIKALTTKYSPTWKQLLETMLRLDEESRPDFNGLYPLQFSQSQPSQPQQNTFVPTKSELRLIETREVPAPPGYSDYVPQKNDYPPPPLPKAEAAFKPYTPAPFPNQSGFQQAVFQPQAFPQSNLQYSGFAAPIQPIFNPQQNFYPGPGQNLAFSQAGLYQNPQFVAGSRIAQPNIGFQQPLGGSVINPQSVRAFSNVSPQRQPVFENQQRPIYETQIIGNSNQGQILERNEGVKRAGVKTSNQDDDQNDLDKRVREALRATQETIERNSKMQNELGGKPN